MMKYLGGVFLLLTAGSLMVYGCLAEAHDELSKITTDTTVKPALSYYVPGPSRGTATPVPRKEAKACQEKDITTLEGRISMIVIKRVIDGDTVEAELDNTAYRLWGIDAPEISQPMGREAKQLLTQELPEGRVIQAYMVGKDPYGRHLAILGEPRQTTANYKMVSRGMAWVYPTNGHNGCLQSAERDARSLNTGLWGQGGLTPQEPWEYRKQE